MVVYLTSAIWEWKCSSTRFSAISKLGFCTMFPAGKDTMHFQESVPTFGARRTMAGPSNPSNPWGTNMSKTISWRKWHSHSQCFATRNGSLFAKLHACFWLNTVPGTWLGGGGGRQSFSIIYRYNCRYISRPLGNRWRALFWTRLIDIDDLWNGGRQFCPCLDEIIIFATLLLVLRFNSPLLFAHEKIWSIQRSLLITTSKIRSSFPCRDIC